MSLDERVNQVDVSVVLAVLVDVFFLEIHTQNKSWGGVHCESIGRILWLIVNISITVDTLTCSATEMSIIFQRAGIGPDCFMCTMLFGCRISLASQTLCQRWKGLVSSCMLSYADDRILSRPVWWSNFSTWPIISLNHWAASNIIRGVLLHLHAPECTRKRSAKCLFACVTIIAYYWHNSTYVLLQDPSPSDKGSGLARLMQNIVDTELPRSKPYYYFQRTK